MSAGLHTKDLLFRGRASELIMEQPLQCLTSFMSFTEAHQEPEVPEEMAGGGSSAAKMARSLAKRWRVLAAASFVFTSILLE